MRYYVQVQRTSHGYAARIAEELWPSGATRRRVCLFLAGIIDRAARNTTAWSITLDPDSIRLNVGPVRLLVLETDRIWFCARIAGRLELPSGVHDCSGRSPVVYPESVNVPSRQYEVAPQELEKVTGALRAAALSYVDEAASRRNGVSLWAKAHSPGMLSFLESYLARRLPQPARGRGDIDDDFPIDAVEGVRTIGLRSHRTRETRLRHAKLREARSRSPDGRLRCEVPGCGFDFEDTYGPIGIGYAQVHHRRPLADASKPVTTRLEDLVVICANCHAMVHRFGECRSLDDLMIGGGD